jgi:hypothetical protein
VIVNIINKTPHVDHDIRMSPIQLSILSVSNDLSFLPAKLKSLCSGSGSAGYLAPLICAADA